jgi:hypothetical protein
MQRIKHKLKQMRQYILDKKRRTWCTFENFWNMYASVYASMVAAGVAEKIEEEVMLDCEGDTVDQEEFF